MTNRKSSKKSDAATTETVTTTATETVTNASPNASLDTLEAQGVPVSNRMRENAKGKREKPVKMIGAFTELEIDKLVQKGDKKNPTSFKAWAKKNVPTLGAETPEIAREAYDEAMAEYRAQHPFSKKDVREILDASAVIAHPRKHTFKKIERSLVVLRKHKIIHEAPKTTWVGGHNVHFQLTYTPLGRLTLGEQMTKKELKKHMARTAAVFVNFGTAATH